MENNFQNQNMNIHFSPITPDNWRIFNALKVKSQEKYDSIILCYIEGDEIARNLYSDMGFHHNGDVDEDEIHMEYDLK